MAIFRAPSAPAIKSATFVSQNLTQATFRLLATPPVALNGSAVSKYYYSFDSGATYSDAGAFDLSAGNVSMTISTVPNDISTNIIIAAENSAGRSVGSAPITVMAIFRAPSAPAIKSATFVSQNLTQATFRIEWFGS
ncbi:hypothetical protein EB093_09160 [bacterium]|nr:hypothetical protein [bacterium]